MRRMCRPGPVSLSPAVKEKGKFEFAPAADYPPLDQGWSSLPAAGLFLEFLRTRESGRDSSEIRVHSSEQFEDPRIERKIPRSVPPQDSTLNSGGCFPGWRHQADMKFFEGQPGIMRGPICIRGEGL